MSNTENMRAQIEARQGRKAYPAIAFVQKNPRIAATLSKLNTPRIAPRHDQGGFRAIENPDRNNFASIAQNIGQKERDADNIMQLFPDMELTKQILVSSIIAPKDMSTTEISFSLPDGLKVTPIAAALLTLVEDYFGKTYKIEPLVLEILEECLFGAGSYALVTLPENSVDDLINGSAQFSMESLREHVRAEDGTFRSIGILGPADKSKIKPKVSLEELFGGNVSRGFKDYDHGLHFTGENNKVITIEGLSITDNPDALKMPKLLDLRRQHNVEYALSQNYSHVGVAALEDYGSGRADKRTANMNDVELTSLFYKNKQRTYRNIVKAKTDEELPRKTVGEPLTFRAPSMAVIPVFTPGNEKVHVGYFMLLDNEGNPLSKHSVTSNYEGLRGLLNNSNNDMASSLLQRASSLTGTNCGAISFDQASKVYSEIVEADLLARLRNGLQGPNVSIASNDEIYRIMLARALEKQGTQLLYVPEGLLTYFAYKYTDEGVGKSLLEDMAQLNSLRAMLLFAQVMAQVKNSIGRTKVNLKLDEDDPNPQKLIEMAMHEVLKARQSTFPLGLNSPSGLADWVQKAGIEFQFSGHPSLPDLELEFSETQTSYATPDTELEENLRKRATMATGISPEMVDNAFSAEFATTVLQNNLLLAKRVKQIQNQFRPLLTKHARQRTRNDGTFMERVRETIKDNLTKIVDVENPDPLITELTDKKDLLIDLLMMEFLGNYELNLAEPDTVSLTNQMEAMQIKSDALDKGLEFVVSASTLPPSMVGEDAGDRVEEVRAIIKGALMRRWMAENGILPELLDITTTDEDGGFVNDIAGDHREYINNMTKAVTELLQGTVPVAQAASRDIQNITGGDELGDSTASAVDTTSSYDAGGGEDPGAGGPEDLDAGMPDDMPTFEF